MPWASPRRNEKRFYRSPLHWIVAVVDHAPNLGHALADLGSAKPLTPPREHDG